MPTIETLNLNEIVPGNNDRTVFNATELAALASSIKEHGLLQPISVRLLDGTDLYQIIAGERRYRAVKLLGRTEIDAIVVDATDEEAAALMLAENTARADLDPIDEALAYQARMTVYGWTVDQVADRAGVTTIRVLFRLKLLKLTAPIQALLRTSNLQMGYAQILADADLDTNRQMLAVSKLRDNPRPTLGWFRSIIAPLVEQQNQCEMFDMDLLTVQASQPSAPIDPPSPTTTPAPKVGKTLREIITNQIAFWQQAADQWAAIGKPFKKQECQAAAAALQFAL